MFESSYSEWRLEIYDETGSLISCEFGNCLWFGERGVAGIAGRPAGSRRARERHGADNFWPGPGRGIAAVIIGLAHGRRDGGAIFQALGSDSVCHGTNEVPGGGRRGDRFFHDDLHV